MWPHPFFFFFFSFFFFRIINFFSQLAVETRLTLLVLNFANSVFKTIWWNSILIRQKCTSDFLFWTISCTQFELRFYQFKRAIWRSSLKSSKTSRSKLSPKWARTNYVSGILKLTHCLSFQVSSEIGSN
jgi:hypothetical protein